MQEPAKTQNAPIPAKPEQGKTEVSATKPSVTGESKTAPATGKETPPTKVGPPIVGPFPPQPTVPLPSAPLLAPNAGVPGVPVKQAEPFRIGSILGPALWLIGVLLLLAFVLAWIKRYQQKDALENRDSVHEQLAKFRQALANGEMSEEEFRKVKTLLTGKIREPVPNATKKPSDVLPGAAPEPTGESTL